MAKGKHWKSHEDLILVEVLTEYVAKGFSIFEAFPEVSKRLEGRTSAACYARWETNLKTIYAEAIDLAKQKQSENAKKVVESILSKQELEVIHAEESKKVELLMPAYIPGPSVPHEFHSSEMTVMTPSTISQITPPESITLTDVINYLSSLDLSTESLREENGQLLDELERSLQEAEALRLEVIRLNEIEHRYNALQKIVKKIESVTV